MFTIYLQVPKYLISFKFTFGQNAEPLTIFKPGRFKQVLNHTHNLSLRQELKPTVAVKVTMYCREFPDLQWLKDQAAKRFEDQVGIGGRALPTKGWPTVILNVATQKTFRNDIRGPLSLFTNLKGVSTVHTGNKAAAVHEGFYYLTNHDQYYTLAIDDKTPVETFNIHFGEFWADQALETITKSPDKLLDEPIFVTPHQRLELHSKLNPKDKVFNQWIDAIKSHAGEVLPEQELLYGLLVHLIKQDQTFSNAAHRLPALKNSTKQELLKRLHLSTDYIYSFHHLDISLDDLAAISCLSKFHFLRLFKIAFNKTPHRFITEVKIQKAIDLLRNSSMEINHIAAQLRFRSASRSAERSLIRLVFTPPT